MRKKRTSIAFFLLCLFCLPLYGCFQSPSHGDSGGLLNGIVQSPLDEGCHSNGASSGSSEGKTATGADGTVAKLPVDYNYGITNQSDFNGANWSGDDSVRGVGLFNISGEEDDKGYSVNMRWTYCSSYVQSSSKYPAHQNYTATTSFGTVGGTSVAVQASNDSDNKIWQVFRHHHYIVYSPETKKAVVCSPGCVNQGSENLNWGGSPAALLGGLSDDACSALGLSGKNNQLLEVFFTSEDTPEGPLEGFTPDGGSGVVVSGGNSCDSTISLDLSNIANLAVSVAYDPKNKEFAGHEAIDEGGCPTTAAAQALRAKAISIAGEGGTETTDCGKFVASVIVTTVDPTYPIQSTFAQEPYCQSHTDKWEQVFSNASLSDIISQKDKLQPGDVFFCTNHTFLYVGNEAIKAQFNYVSDNYCIVGASLNQHGPSIQTLEWQNSSKTYSVYRCIAPTASSDS